jgi:hypothetical protein
MSQNHPGGDTSHPGDPNNLSTIPQQPADQPDDMQQRRPEYPQRRQKSSERSEVTGWAIAATLLILICVSVGVGLYIGAQKAKDAVRSGAAAIGAASQVGHFCGAYRSQDYGSAYQLLSAAAQGRTSQTQYVSHQQALDARAGVVAACSIDPHHTLPSMSSDGNTATAQIQVARGANAKLTTGTLTMVYEDNTWKIDRADSSLTLL